MNELLQRIFNSRLSAQLKISLKEGVPLQGATMEDAVAKLAKELRVEFPESHFALKWQLSFFQEYQPEIVITEIKSYSHNEATKDW